MTKMQLSVMAVGPFMANCWVLKDEKTGKALVVDPGFYSSELENFLRKIGISELEYILITHGHLDHFCGAPYIKEKFGGKIVIGEKDKDETQRLDSLFLGTDYEEQFKPFKADITVSDGEKLNFCGESIEILHTPGHTKGEVCYIINDMLFSGDVLFQGSIGRTDLDGGNVFMLVESLKKLVLLDKNYKILTGHGEKTTLDFEKETNRYLKAACSKK